MTTSPQPSPEIHRFHDGGTTVVIVAEATDDVQSLVGAIVELDPMIACDLKSANHEFIKELAFVWFGTDRIGLGVDEVLFNVPIRSSTPSSRPHPFTPDGLAAFLLGLSAETLNGYAILSRAALEAKREKARYGGAELPSLRVTMSAETSGVAQRVSLLESLWYSTAKFRLAGAAVTEGLLSLVLEDGAVLVQEWCDDEMDWSGRLVLLPAPAFDEVELH